MARQGVEIEGAAEIAGQMRRAARQMGNLTEANAQAGAVVAARGRSGAPRRTGRLAGSITPVRTPREAEIGSSLPYAGVIHWGWPRRNIPARPFLADALASTEAQTVDIYMAATDKALAIIKGKGGM